MPIVLVMASVIQYFVRERRYIRHHTIAKDTMDLLEGMGFIEIEHNCHRDLNAALRSVQRLLNRLGY